MYFIGIIKDAALALKLLAGTLTYLLFSIEIIRTVFFMIPVLSVSLSYSFSEAFKCQSGFSKSTAEGRLFD